MKIVNRQAYHEYQILEKIEAGIALTGAEVKSIKSGRIKLQDSFVRIRGSEAWLHNAHIPLYPFADNREYNPTRPRRLLLRRKELRRLNEKVNLRGLTVVPISCYTKGRLIKLRIALAKGKKAYEKREAIKRRDLQREVERELAERHK